MKKMKWMILSASAVLVLAACGQGENNNTEENNEVSGTEITNSEVNNNNDEMNNENEANNEENNNEENNNVNESNENEENDVNEENNVNAANEENNVDEATEEDEAVIEDVTLFFSDDQLMDTYRVSSGHSVTENEAGGVEAMELWAAGPTAEGLYSLLPEGTSVEYVEFHDDVAHVSFSEHINDANLGSSGEMMLIDQIALMMEQFGYDQTLILIEGESAGEFLGHMDLSEPVQAPSPDDYEWME